ncbi:unnamed protein product [Moneuplotes crassus]|uniref:Uncharacterized protein n=1 Tax=Euplotes crassus TaxID=5936 RepID=A0AAD1UAG0_EUPCR|nr:unnamed protein product [Moneuplotes crassus]
MSVKCNKLESHSTVHLAKNLNPSYITNELDKIKKQMYEDANKEMSIDFLHYMNSRFKLSRENDNMRRKIFLNYKNSDQNKLATRMMKEKNFRIRRKEAKIKRKIDRQFQPGKTNLYKAIQKNLEGGRRNLNDHFKRYQDETSWFDFEKFYCSLKAKNVKHSPNEKDAKIFLETDQFSKSSEETESLRSKQKTAGSKVKSKKSTTKIRKSSTKTGKSSLKRKSTKALSKNTIPEVIPEVQENSPKSKKNDAKMAERTKMTKKLLAKSILKFINPKTIKAKSFKKKKENLLQIKKKVNSGFKQKSTKTHKFTVDSLGNKSPNSGEMLPKISNASLESRGLASESGKQIMHQRSNFSNTAKEKVNKPKSKIKVQKSSFLTSPRGNFSFRKRSATIAPQFIMNN